MIFRTLLTVITLASAGTMSQAADVSQDAIDACIDRLRAESSGGGEVLGTECSEANSLVTLRDGGGTVWSCLVGNDGSQPELQAAAGSPASGHAAESIGAGAAAQWIVNVATKLNVHAAPSPTAPTIGSLPGGTRVEGRACQEEAGRIWCEIVDGDVSGWVAQEFLDPAGAAGAAMPARSAAPAAMPSGGIEQIRFGSGRTGTDVAGTLSPGDTRRYALGARSGQDLSVEFWTTDPAIEYQIFLPDGRFLLDRISNTKPYGGSPFMNGEHVIEVINRGQAPASYNMSVEIR